MSREERERTVEKEHFFLLLFSGAQEKNHVIDRVVFEEKK
jgi:hypothetical protein